jgi:predicted small integral membrane protein
MPFIVLSVSILVVIVLTYVNLKKNTSIARTIFRRRSCRRQSFGRYIQDISNFIGLYFLAWAIPLLFIWWVMNPEQQAKGIKKTVFVIGTTIGILYYANNSEKFSSVSGTIGYFSAVLITPYSVASIILD